MQVIEATLGNPVDVTLRISVAATLFERIRGLLGRPSPKRGEGLLITKCKTVHTIGMAYPIDVVYLDRDWRVVGVAHSVSPGCFKAPTPPRRSGVVQVIELADREAAWIGLFPGTQLKPSTFQPTQQGDCHDASNRSDGPAPGRARDRSRRRPNHDRREHEHHSPHAAALDGLHACRADAGCGQHVPGQRPAESPGQLHADGALDVQR